jgi:hypothetical protein
MSSFSIVEDFDVVKQAGFGQLLLEERSLIWLTLSKRKAINIGGGYSSLPSSLFSKNSSRFQAVNAAAKAHKLVAMARKRQKTYCCDYETFVVA